MRARRQRPERTRHRRGALFHGIGCVVIVVVSAMLLDAGVPSASATPHKPRHAQPAVAPRDTDQDTTATIPSKPPVTSSTTIDDEALPPPYRLPKAPRRRMRECGRKWQTMKMSGAVAEQIWRDFATQCLAAANGPFDKRTDH